MGIGYETRGAVAIITLDRPDKLNAMSLAMYDDLGAAYCRARDDDAVHAIVLTGATVFALVLMATGGRGLQRAPRAAVL